MTIIDKKLLIIEDHPVVREGLLKALISYGFTKIFEGASCAEGRGQLAKNNPEILITDLHLPDGLSFEMISWARKLKPDMAIIILTVESSPNFLLAAAESGANALIHKSSPVSKVISAIEVATRSPKSFTAEGLSEAMKRERAKPKLTPRELEVLEKLISGAALESIGKALYISLPTVKTHLSSIYRKLECDNRTSAITRAIALGLVHIK